MALKRLVWIPLALAAFGQPPAQQAKTDQPAKPQLAHFHHVHINAVDPQASIDYYTTHFNGEKAKFDGKTDAVWTGKNWLLFTKVKTPPPSDIDSAFYHIGYGAKDAKATYQRLLSEGVKFETPQTDLAELLGGNPGRGTFAYAFGPDKELIELNTSAQDQFQHVHLLSDDPVTASEWYIKEFGLQRRGAPASREARSYKGVQIAPAVFLTMDHVLVFWFPTGTAKGLYPKLWEGRTKLEPSRGHVLDHFAFSVDNLDETLARLKKDGVKILQGPRKMPGATTTKSAFIQAPDDVVIEIVEGAAHK